MVRPCDGVNWKMGRYIVELTGSKTWNVATSVGNA
jgi:hypothetical protein